MGSKLLDGGFIIATLIGDQTACQFNADFTGDASVVFL